MFSLTIFNNIFDNKTDKRQDFNTWQDFEKLLYNLSKVHGLKYNKTNGKNQKSSPLISPAVYNKSDDKRRNENVKGWAKWAALDIDDHDLNPDTFKDELLEKYKNTYFVCYSTASSKKEYPKFRLVFPLSRFVSSKELKHFWFALNKEFGNMSDRQVKDKSRMYYVPAIYPDAYNFIFTNSKGKFIDVDWLLLKHELIEKNNGPLSKFPKEIQEALIKEKQKQLTNYDYFWSSYEDCPFLNQRLVIEYKQITNSGWYAGLYAIMVNIAGNAIERGYPITAQEIADICKSLDNDTGNWYNKRPLVTEAQRAIDYVFETKLL